MAAGQIGAPSRAGAIAAAAHALAKTGDYKRAASELLVIATQHSPPPVLRSNAYATIVRVHADQEDWPKAIAAYLEWVASAARDGGHCA